MNEIHFILQMLNEFNEHVRDTYRYITVTTYAFDLIIVHQIMSKIIILSNTCPITES